ncbi:MAG: hypothetical protein EA359_13275 [Balneolaceae bacterium]|nr:MAG: hypothetical protein EA359_13275 [Balneolaceae bacterium]
MVIKKYVPANVDVVVTSYGGVGTTFIMDFISQQRRVNDKINEDRLKHLPYPPLSIDSNQKFIYIFGDPVMAAISLFRRKLHYPQSKRIIHGLRNNQQPIPRSMTIEQYASEGVDRFYFQEHFRNWYNSMHTNPIIFLRYETLKNHLEKIFDYLDLPHELVSTFPEFRVRESYNHKLSDNTLIQLQTIYHEFNQELDQVPDIKVYYPNSRNFLKTITNYKLYSMSRIYWGMNKAIGPLYERMKINKL